MLLGENSIKGAVAAGVIKIAPYQQYRVRDHAYVLTVAPKAYRASNWVDRTSHRDFLMYLMLLSCVAVTREVWAVLALWLFYMLCESPIVVFGKSESTMRHPLKPIEVQPGFDTKCGMDVGTQYFTVHSRQTICLVSQETVHAPEVMALTVTPDRDWNEYGITAEATYDHRTKHVHLLITNRTRTSIVVPVGKSLAHVAFTMTLDDTPRDDTPRDATSAAVENTIPVEDDSGPSSSDDSDAE